MLPTKSGLDGFQGIDVFLQTIDMLLHLDNRFAELRGATERTARLAGFLHSRLTEFLQLCIGTSLGQ